MSKPNESQIYLCRAFDQLNKGEDYISCNPAIQIGILDFTLFPEYPEFFDTYKLQNIKTKQLYSDKFTIHVLDLNHTVLATGEDVHYKIDYWAKLFKASGGVLSSYYAFSLYSLSILRIHESKRSPTPYRAWFADFQSKDLGGHAYVSEER